MSYGIFSQIKRLIFSALRVALIFIVFCETTFAQIPKGTDIYLLDCQFKKNSFLASNPKKITQHVGYDNQPFFTKDGQQILYSSNTESLQTDICAYKLADSSTQVVCSTKESEYSPVKDDAINCLYFVSVEKDSSQKLKLFDWDKKDFAFICEHIDSIGYYSKISDKEFVFFKITEPPTLWYFSSDNCQEKYLTNNCGRSLHKKSKNEIYFTQLIDSSKWICSLNLKTLTIEKIIKCLPGSEDFEVFNKNQFLMANASKLFTCKNQNNAQWKELCSFENKGIQNIKRIKMNAQKTKIAFVCDEVNIETNEK